MMSCSRTLSSVPRLSVNEFNPLFIRDGFDSSSSVCSGTNELRAIRRSSAVCKVRFRSVLASRRRKPTATDRTTTTACGQYDGFLQAQIADPYERPSELELTSTERESGDLTSAFRSESFFSTELPCRTGRRELPSSDSDRPSGTNSDLAVFVDLRGSTTLNRNRRLPVSPSVSIRRGRERWKNRASVPEERREERT